MRSIRAVLILVFAAPVVAFMLLWVRDCFNVDRCLDAGGRYDYDMELCEGARERPQ